MSYFRKPFGADIEMSASFVGNLNALPLCAKAPYGTWCRDYIGGSARQSTAGVGVLPPSKPGTQPSSSGIADFFKALVSGVPAAQPAAQPVYIPQPSSGISTTTLAVAGGAALLLLYLATRK